MSLQAKQARFARMIAQLILYADRMGYQMTFGEAYRPPETAEIYARRGTGISNSLHGDRLAVDFNLFKGGVYLPRTVDHKPLGEFWESIGGTWGGRFGDGNHYSLAHDGRK